MNCSTAQKQIDMDQNIYGLKIIFRFELFSIEFSISILFSLWIFLNLNSVHIWIDLIGAICTRILFHIWIIWVKSRIFFPTSIIYFYLSVKYFITIRFFKISININFLNSTSMHFLLIGSFVITIKLTLLLKQYMVMPRFRG